MEKIVNFCVLKMIEQEIIVQQQRNVIAYGLELFFSSVINVLSIMFLGVILGKENFTILVLLVSIPLQSFGGGYHCDTHFRCWVMTISGYLMTLLIAQHLYSGFLLLLAFVSGYPFLCLSPVENPKAPFGDKFKNTMRKSVHISYILAMIISSIFLILRREESKYFLACVWGEGVSVLCAKYKRKKIDN